MDRMTLEVAKKILAMSNYLFLALVFGFLCQGCMNKECDFDGVKYEFELLASLSPARDTFRIGDTILISSSFSDDVFEVNSQRTFNLVNFRFHPGTGMYKIDTFPAIDDGLQFFDAYISPEYSYQRVGEELLGQYNYENGVYSLEFKLIPRKPGLYYLEQGSALFPMDEWQDFPGKCRYISSDARVTLNGGSDNNIEFLSDSPDSHYNAWILSDPDDLFYKFGGYCFYVVE